MDKKELLIKILEKLSASWGLAENMIALVKSEYCTPELLDALIGFINSSVKQLGKTTEKQIDLKNALEEIEKMKQNNELK